MKAMHSLAIVVLGLGMVLSGITSASAAAFNRTHPRRAEVNQRLAVQNARIHRGVKEGTITPQEAKQLHTEDRSIRAEERSDAAAHNGHVTKGEQIDLNKNENAISRDIYNAAHN